MEAFLTDVVSAKSEIVVAYPDLKADCAIMPIVKNFCLNDTHLSGFLSVSSSKSFERSANSSYSPSV